MSVRSNTKMHKKLRISLEIEVVYVYRTGVRFFGMGAGLSRVPGVPRLLGASLSDNLSIEAEAAGGMKASTIISSMKMEFAVLAESFAGEKRPRQEGEEKVASARNEGKRQRLGYSANGNDDDDNERESKGEAKQGPRVEEVEEEDEDEMNAAALKEAKAKMMAAAVDVRKRSARRDDQDDEDRDDGSGPAAAALYKQLTGQPRVEDL